MKTQTKFYGPGIGNVFLDMTQKEQVTKEKKVLTGLHQNYFCATKEILNK